MSILFGSSQQEYAQTRPKTGKTSRSFPPQRGGEVDGQETDFYRPLLAHKPAHIFNQSAISIKNKKCVFFRETRVALCVGGKGEKEK